MGHPRRPVLAAGRPGVHVNVAVGYGGSASRYTEEKRVVFHKDLGPLISAQEMARCIHCTRCVRFMEQVAGVVKIHDLHVWSVTSGVFTLTAHAVVGPDGVTCLEAHLPAGRLVTIARRRAAAGERHRRAPRPSLRA